MANLPEPESDLKRLGPVRFFGILLGFLIWVAIGVWTAWTAQWPASCSFESRNILKRFATALWCSPSLLSNGIPGSVHFLWIWSLGLPVIAALIFGLFKSRQSRAPQVRNTNTKSVSE